MLCKLWKMKYMTLFLLFFLVITEVDGLDAQQWKALHEKMMKKAEAKKAAKMSQADSSNVDSTDTVLVENIPIRLEYKDDIIDVEFRLYNHPDPTTQAKDFCKKYDLTENYCTALTNRAVDSFMSATAKTSKEHPPAEVAGASVSAGKSSTASKLAELLKKRRVASADARSPPTSTNSENTILLDTIPIQIEDGGTTINVEFKLYSGTDSLTQAKAFCEEYNLLDDYCRALCNRAEEVFAAASLTTLSINPETPDNALRARDSPEYVDSFSSEEVIGTIPIQIEDGGAPMNVEFHIYSGSDVLTQARVFCKKYDLMTHYCTALCDRAVEITRESSSGTADSPKFLDGTTTTASKLAKILRERRKSVGSNVKRSPFPKSPDDEILGTIPIQIEDGGAPNNIDFHLYRGADALTQAKSFCKEYNLLAEHCTALCNRAEAIYVSATQSVAESSKLNDFESKRRASAEVSEAYANDIYRDLLDTIPIQIEGGGAGINVEFKLYSGTDALTQAKAFCTEYNLLEDYCTALCNRAESAYAAAIQNKLPRNLAKNSAAGELIQTIPVRLEYEDEVLDTEFSLYRSPKPSEQVRVFCDKHDLSEAYCEALRERAEVIFNSASIRDGETSLSSVASKLANLLRKRREASTVTVEEQTPVTTSLSGNHRNVVDIIPIRLEYEDNEIVELEFEIFDDMSPSGYVKDFCNEHDLVEEYCNALAARADFLYSNSLT